MKSFSKYVLGILCLAMLLATALFGAVQLYWYHHPKLEITYSMSADGTTSMPRLLVSKESLWGYSNSVKQQLLSYSEQESAMERYLLTTYHSPRLLSTKAETKDGQTILTFTGWGTLENGNICEINEQLIFDFIITDIPTP